MQIACCNSMNEIKFFYLKCCGNPPSNKAAGHYHGTSMTVLQFPLSTRPGKIKSIEYELTFCKTLSKKSISCHRGTLTLYNWTSRRHCYSLRYVGIIFQNLSQMLYSKEKRNNFISFILFLAAFNMIHVSHGQNIMSRITVNN